MRRAGAVAIVATSIVWLVPATPAGALRTASGDRPSSPAQGIAIAAAGDIACPSDPGSDPNACRYDDTSDLLIGTGVSRVLALGDNQYDVGAYRDYLRYFDAWWGRVLPRIRPVPGNHEYAQDPSARPRGYFRYFGARVKGPDGLGYYSYDLPKGCSPGGTEVCWHLIALSSELCFAPGGCGPPTDPSAPGTGNRMYAWLGEDLAAHPNARYPCTIAYWHHPLFSDSTGSGASAAVRPLWRLLHAARADIVLNGHSHNYQRWRPQDPDGRLDRTRGIREFVVGTGGASHYTLVGGAPPRNLAAAQDDAFGVLRLTLRRSSYRWAWVGAAGQPAFTDAKAAAVACV